MSSIPDNTALARKTRKTALVCAGVALGMVTLAFASSPLYDLFCKATGFAGTPLMREANTSVASGRVVTVRLDANVAPGLNWSFEAESTTIPARVGDTQTVFYKVTNRGRTATTGIAAFNVEPAQAAAHFVKIQCFCFTEHRLEPGESMDAPVVFYIDPEIEKNRELRTLRSMTLSYTYFPAKNGQPLAATKADGDKPKL
jgi:cytochrome c oxidase assembly protein subunit 11